jgi:LPS export ABC transporter protein LptC
MRIFYRKPKTENRKPFFYRKPFFTSLLLVLAILITMAQTPVPPQPGGPPADDKQARMDEIRFTEVIDGVKKWVLVAQRADYLKDQDIVHISGVEVEFFRKDDESIRIKGESGYINFKTRELALEGKVEIETAQYKFETSRISYLPAERALVAAESVKIQGPRLVVEGNGLKIDLDHKKLVLAEHKMTRWQLPGKLWK